MNFVKHLSFFSKEGKITLEFHKEEYSNEACWPSARDKVKNHLCTHSSAQFLTNGTAVSSLNLIIFFWIFLLNSIELLNNKNGTESFNYQFEMVGGVGEMILVFCGFVKFKRDFPSTPLLSVFFFIFSSFFFSLY